MGANLVLPDLMERSVVGNLVWGVATASLSVAVTIALLRYRLFEIDRLISRTATYALVTAVLAGTYVAIAILPAALYGLDSDLLVAAATLASAGLFSRSAGTCRHRWTAASTGHATTPRASPRRSEPARATPSIPTASSATSSVWSRPPSARPARRCGCALAGSS